MEFRNVGTSGLVVSLVGLGCNNLGLNHNYLGARIDEEVSRTLVLAALDGGVTLFDTSHGYGDGQSEVFLGRALAGHRNEVVISTKFASRLAGSQAHAPASRRSVHLACDGSLRRLGVDWIDLYYLHSPDPRTPLEETLDALNDLVRQGKVRYVGISNHSAGQIVHADQLARGSGLAPPVAVQVQWNLLHRHPEQEVAPACRECGIGIIPSFPLASGLLTGKYRVGEPIPEGSRFASTRFLDFATKGGALAPDAANLATVERLRAVAEERSLTLLQLAASWLASQPEVSSVIAGATSPKQVQENAGSVVPLSVEDLEAVNQALLPVTAAV